MQLRKIEFPENSELKAIGQGAFANSKIEYFTIPSHVKEICSDTFSFCFQLQKVDIQKNSELQKIEKNAFRCSLVESITIPSGAALADGWCIGTSRLTNVQIAEDSCRNLSSAQAYLYWYSISGLKLQSGLGSSKKETIERRTALIFKFGAHFS